MAIVSAEWEELLKKSKPTNLTKDMVIDIMIRLPVKSIIRFKSACKPWHNFLNEAKFSQMHLNRAISSGNDYLLLRHLSARMMPGREIGHTLSSVLWNGGFHMRYRKEVYSFRSKHNFKVLERLEEPNSANNLMVGSINGIVCLIGEDNDHSNFLEKICLWNPAIRELKVLPRPFFQGCNRYKTVGIGFAYVQSSNDYKVVVVLKVCGTKICKVMVYSLSTDCWNQSDITITGIFQDLVAKVYANGRLHWLSYETLVQEYFILCFEPNEENFSRLELPVVSSRACRVSILPAPPALGESLVALTSSENEGCVLWFMREYGVKESWTKLYSIPQWIAYKMEPLGWFNPGVLICVISENRLLISYNLFDRKMNTLQIRATTATCYGTYIQSLVSLGGTKPLPNRHPPYYTKTSKVKMWKRQSPGSRLPGSGKWEE